MWPKVSKTVITPKALPASDRTDGFGDAYPGISDRLGAHQSAVVASVVNALNDFASHIQVQVVSKADVAPMPNMSTTQVVNESISIGEFSFNVRSSATTEIKEDQLNGHQAVILTFADGQGEHAIIVQDGKLQDKEHVKYHDYLMRMINQGGFKAIISEMNGSVHCELKYIREASN